MATPTASRPATPTPSRLPPVPGSPVFSLASTANPLSQFNLPLPPPPRPAHAVITKADLERSQDAYAELLASAKAYRIALATLSTAASTFGSALEACARLKEARSEAIGPSGAASMTASFTTKGQCTADTLLSASGVHHLIANHQQILSETVYRSFEVPLLHDLDKWQTVIDDEEETYQQKIKAQSREVKRLEKEGLKLHKQRRRDVARFRAHLVDLTQKLDGLTTLHADHARTLLRESQETSGRIVDASCSLVRAEVDIFEGLARKGWSGGGLDDMLEKGQDLFATEYEGNHGSGTGGTEGVKLFSILPPKSILADSTSDPRSDSLLMETDRYQSLTGVAADSRPHMGGGDSESVFSADFNRPRNARPFSPQPIRRTPTDVTYDSLGSIVGESSNSRLHEDDLLPLHVNEDIKEEDEDEENYEEARDQEHHQQQMQQMQHQEEEEEEEEEKEKREEHQEQKDKEEDYEDDNEEERGRRLTESPSPFKGRDSPEPIAHDDGEHSPEVEWGSTAGEEAGKQ